MRRLAFVLGCGLLVAHPAQADDVLDALPPLRSGAMRVYLVRHGQALSNLEPAPELPPEALDHLTELGARQAAAVGGALAGRRVSHVFSSPAMRARETAEAVARVLGFGAPPIEARLAPMAPGESTERVADRVGTLVRALARSRRGTSVVLVAHGEVIGAYLEHVGVTPAAKGLANGSITIVDVVATGAETIRLANHVPVAP